MLFMWDSKPQKGSYGMWGPRIGTIQSGAQNFPLQSIGVAWDGRLSLFVTVVQTNNMYGNSEFSDVPDFEWGCRMISFRMKDAHATFISPFCDFYNP